MARRAALDEARKQSASHATALKLRQDEARAGELARGVAEKARADSQAALERHGKSRPASIRPSRRPKPSQQQLPDDPNLSEAAQKLKAKSSELQSVLPGLGERIEAAAVILRQAERETRLGEPGPQGVERRDDARRRVPSPRPGLRSLPRNRAGMP